MTWPQGGRSRPRRTAAARASGSGVRICRTKVVRSWVHAGSASVDRRGRRCIPAQRATVYETAAERVPKTGPADEPRASYGRAFRGSPRHREARVRASRVIASCVTASVVATAAPSHSRRERAAARRRSAKSARRRRARNATWVAGYWHWTGIQYAWIPGHWDAPPPGRRVECAAYVQNNGAYFYEPGGWKGRRSAPRGRTRSADSPGSNARRAIVRVDGAFACRALRFVVAAGARRRAPRCARGAAGPGAPSAIAARGPCSTSRSRPTRATTSRYGLRLDGELPAAINTPSGLVTAPDPRAPIPDTPKRPGLRSSPRRGATATRRLRPGQRHTKARHAQLQRPLLAQHRSVQAARRVRRSRRPLQPSRRGRPDAAASPCIRGCRRTARRISSTPTWSSTSRRADRTRIPSVGPGAHVVHARLGVGSEDVPFELLRDGAENWFVEDQAHRPRAARPRALHLARGVRRRVRRGERPPPVSPLPPAVRADAAVVARRIGVSRERRDRETRSRRSSRTSAPSPSRTSRSRVTLDGACISTLRCRRKVCAVIARTRSSSPRSASASARAWSLNEAHAWVEVADGAQWRRVDLGWAGMLLDRHHEDKTVPYQAPPDPFDWPAGASAARTWRGRGAHVDVGEERGAGAASGAAHVARRGRPPTPGAAAAEASNRSCGDGRLDGDLIVSGAPRRPRRHALRGQLVHVHGATFMVRGRQVRVRRRACAHVVVEIRRPEERERGAARRARHRHGRHVCRRVRRPRRDPSPRLRAGRRGDGRRALRRVGVAMRQP